MHRRRVTTGAEVAREQRQPSVGLAAAERDRIGRELGVQQTLWVEIAVLRAKLMHCLHFAEFDTHHAGAHAQAPAITRLRFGANTRIAERLFAGRQGEAMRTRRKLKQLAVGGDRVCVEVLNLGPNPSRETPRVEARDWRDAAASRNEIRPGRRRVVADGRHQANAGDGDSGPFVPAGAPGKLGTLPCLAALI